MSRSLREYLLILLVACTACASQLFLKQGMKSGGALSLTSLAQFAGLLRQVLTSPLLLLGYGLSAVTAVLWLILLSRLDLSFAALMVNATFYVLLLVSSALFLREAITPWRWAGALLIVAGAMLVSRTG
jgi:drug/metabolite transporter (DMT)-like permease